MSEGQNFMDKLRSFFSRKEKQTSDSVQKSGKHFSNSDSVESSYSTFDTDKTVVFTDNEIKSFEKGYSFGKTAYIPPISGNKTKKQPGGLLFTPRTKKPNFVLGVILTTFKLAIVAIFVIVAVAAGLVFGLANAYLETTPDLDVNKIEDQALSSYIYDQDGKLLATYTGSQNRDWAKLDEIPKDLQNAIIAVEDIRFYSHNGVDVKRILGALVSNLSSSTTEGGSTLTQQLIKNSLLTPERSYKRKLQEAYLSVQLEKNYSKDQILTAYLNTIPLGGTVYGVKAAAKDYFGKDLSELSLREIVCIAAITQYPHAYNPRRATYVTGEVGALQNRMNIVTQRMYAAGFITKEQYDETFVPKSVWDSPDYLAQWKSEMNVLETSPSNELYPYPHFIEYVIYDVETHLLRKYGLDDTPQNRATMEEEIRSNGYKITATIDEDIQDTVQTTISEWDKYPDFENESDNYIEQSDGSEIIEPQASSVIIDNKTGFIVAMIGSRDTPTSKKTLNRAYEAPMPVGSSIKPIAVYGPAFDKGLSPATPIANVPVAIKGWDTEAGYPLTSKGTPGPTSIRTGLVNSWNIVAARTLMDYVGLENSASYLQKMGVNMDNVNVDGVGLALGSSALTTLEMAACYATIANDGYYREPVAFTTVTDKDGNVVLDSTKTRNEGQVYKSSSAWMLVDVLTQAVESGTGHNAQIDGITVAGKTGTVVDNKGVFFAGMTGYYTSTLWVGHDAYKPFVSGIAASNTSAPLWQSYMSKIYEEKGLGDKPIIDKTAEQEGLIEASCDAITGGAPVDGIPSNTDWFLNGTVPTKTSDDFSLQRVCTVSGMLATANCPAAAVVDKYVAMFPADSPYAIWLANGGVLTNLNATPLLTANQTCTVHTAGYSTNVTYATSVLADVNNKMAQYGSQMSQAQKDEITPLIQALINVINRVDSSDEALATSANIVAAKMNEIIAALAAPTPTATPAPAQTPTPAPTDTGIPQ